MTSAIPASLAKCALEPSADDRHSTAVPPKKEAKNRRVNPEGRHAAQPRPHPTERPRPGVLGRTGPSQAVIGLLPAFFAIALYLPSLSYGWVWDDAFLASTHGGGGVGAEGFRLLTSLLFRAEWMLGWHPSWPPLRRDPPRARHLALLPPRDSGGGQDLGRVHVGTSLRGASRPRRGGGLHLRPAGPLATVFAEALLLARTPGSARRKDAILGVSGPPTRLFRPRSERRWWRS
jgi:hypothetical protein